MTLLCWKCH